MLTFFVLAPDDAQVWLAALAGGWTAAEYVSGRQSKNMSDRYRILRRIILKKICTLSWNLYFLKELGHVTYQWNQRWKIHLKNRISLLCGALIMIFFKKLTYLLAVVVVAALPCPWPLLLWLGIDVLFLALCMEENIRKCYRYPSTTYKIRTFFIN